MKNANMPAMPLTNGNGAPIHHSNAGMDNDGVMFGMTKREMMAMHIASGFAADKEVSPCNIANMAIEVADALLAELGRTK